MGTASLRQRTPWVPALGADNRAVHPTSRLHLWKFAQWVKTAGAMCGVWWAVPIHRSRVPRNRAPLIAADPVAFVRGLIEPLKTGEKIISSWYKLWMYNRYWPGRQTGIRIGSTCRAARLKGTDAEPGANQIAEVHAKSGLTNFFRRGLPGSAVFPSLRRVAIGAIQEKN